MTREKTIDKALVFLREWKREAEKGNRFIPSRFLKEIQTGQGLCSRAVELGWFERTDKFGKWKCLHEEPFEEGDAKKLVNENRIHIEENLIKDAPSKHFERMENTKENVFNVFGVSDEELLKEVHRRGWIGEIRIPTYKVITL
jgi:hypothetical protein